MFRGVVDLQAVDQGFGLLRRKDFIERGSRVGVKLSKGVTSLTRLQNRTGVFRHIRLLNDRAFVIGTIVPFCMAFIVAMSMECDLVAQFFSPSLAFWGEMIHFDVVSIPEV
jgi:hypothetical protein